MFIMRFDMRAPEFGGSTTDLYKAAIDMAEWAETHGGFAAVISEHHTSSDGYIPSPLLLASAMAARTTTLQISIAAALLAFYDPIRLAEDMAVLDIISNGRLSYTLGLGYRPEEFEMYGIDWKRRGAVVEEKLQLLLKAKTGEPFEHDGRRIHVTPPPITPGGPMVMWGGGSIAAAKRAGRYGLGFFAQSDLAGMQEAYEESCREHGHEPGMTQLPPPDSADHGVRRRRRRQGVGRDRRVHPPRREDVRRLEPRRRDHRQHLARADGRGAAGDVAGAQDLQHRGGDRDRAQGRSAAHADAAVRWHPARDRLALPRARRRRRAARAQG